MRQADPDLREVAEFHLKEKLEFIRLSTKKSHLQKSSVYLKIFYLISTQNMTNLSTLKKRVYTQLKNLTEEKITQAEKAVAAAIEARDGETKSSAGDKFETGRAMMQLEQQRHEVQLSKAFQLSADLDRLDIDEDYPIVKPGAIVQTNRGIYFVGIGMGKIKIEEEVIYCCLLYTSDAADE